MGSPLAPVFANLFMSHYEKEWLSNYDGFSPSYYTRYADDIFSVFNSHDEAKRFFSYLNSRHHNIKFTMETEVNKVFPFLDVLIVKIIAIFGIQLLIINRLILVYYLILTVLLLVFTK